MLVKSASITVDASVILNVSVPVPPATVSVVVKLAVANLSVSSPAPPVIVSTKAPAVIVSAPEPPVAVTAAVALAKLTDTSPVALAASKVKMPADNALVIVRSASPETDNLEVSTPEVSSVVMVLARLVDVMAKVSSSLVVPPASVIVTFVVPVILFTVKFWVLADPAIAASV